MIYKIKLSQDEAGWIKKTLSERQEQKYIGFSLPYKEAFGLFFAEVPATVDQNCIDKMQDALDEVFNQPDESVYVKLTHGDRIAFISDKDEDNDVCPTCGR